MATYGQFIVFDFTTTYPGATVTHYAAGTTTLQNVWTDRAKATPAAQPVVSDSNGVVSFYGDGIYKFVVKDAAGTTLYTWDNVNLVDLPLTGEGANLTSAATITFGTDGDYFHITGAIGPITNFSGSQGQVVTTFDSTPTLTHSATIILKGAVNYTCVANDVFGWANEGSGVWREIFRSGTAVSSVASGGTGLATITNHGVMLGQGTSAVVATAAGTAAQGLISGGASADPFYVEIDYTGMIRNATFTATVAANALTLALKTKAGTDPSATDPVYVSFRPAGLTSGLYVTRTITAALSVVVSSGSTLGTSNATAANIWWGFLDNAGTVELAVWNPLVSTFSEGGVVSSTAEGGAGGADSANTLYSTTARTNVAFRHGGFITITEATAGTWATAPTVLQNFGTGINIPLGAPGTLTAGTTLTLNPYAINTTTTTAHGLGVRPKFFEVQLECLTAELGYVTGDIVPINSGVHQNGANTSGLEVFADATNTVLNIANNTQISITGKTAGVITTITVANWKVNVVPYKLN